MVNLLGNQSPAIGRGTSMAVNDLMPWQIAIHPLGIVVLKRHIGRKFIIDIFHKEVRYDILQEKITDRAGQDLRLSG